MDYIDLRSVSYFQVEIKVVVSSWPWCW